MKKYVLADGEKETEAFKVQSTVFLSAGLGSDVMWLETSKRLHSALHVQIHFNQVLTD